MLRGHLEQECTAGDARGCGGAALATAREAAAASGEAADAATAAMRGECCASFEPAASVAARLGLEPHPEGGFFKRWHALASGPGGARPACSSILYLLPAGCVSTLHALRDADELWFYQEGSPLTVVELLPEGGVRRTAVRAGEPHAVPAGRVFGAALRSPAPGCAPWALVACTVAPAFEWASWEHPSREELRLRFPSADARAAIEELGRTDK
jgi:predicted cupin superfamily sugar epimerase